MAPMSRLTARAASAVPRFFHREAVSFNGLYVAYDLLPIQSV